MHFDKFSFGSIEIDGVAWDSDVVIDRGKVAKRKKKASKRYREEFGHTPLSIEEDIPWKCRRLLVGTGANGGLPVMEEVLREAERRQVELLVVPTTSFREGFLRNECHMSTQPIVVTIDPNTAKVDTETFWIKKHLDQSVVWKCEKPFTVEFNPNDCPFYEWQFSQDAPCSGLARRNVVADEYRTYKYTVRVQGQVNDPGGGVKK